MALAGSRRSHYCHDLDVLPIKDRVWESEVRLQFEAAGRVPERRNLLFDQGDQGAGGTVARPVLGLFKC